MLLIIPATFNDNTDSLQALWCSFVLSTNGSKDNSGRPRVNSQGQRLVISVVAVLFTQKDLHIFNIQFHLQHLTGESQT